MPYQSLDDLVRTPSTPDSPTQAHPLASPPLARDPQQQQHGTPQPTAQDEAQTRTTWQLNQLTVGILGAQLTWTVEMAYGTPYLLSLGLTKQATSLVWMAGPLSGLIVQPVVGALSDAAQGSRFRRRFYILLSAALIVLSTLLVAYAREVATLVCSFTGLGDWDPSRQGSENTIAIVCGVLGFYVLDFSLNGLQASLRALVLDLSPSHLQSVSNAWLGRHTHLGNIIGYLFGYLDLGHWSFLSFLDTDDGQGGSQFRKLAVISLMVMLATVGITCATQHEGGRSDGAEGAKKEGEAEVQVAVWKRVWQVGADVKDNFRQLPIPVRRVCYVQFFNWTAWFPFLFYSTTYVAEELYSSLPRGAPLPSTDDATRSGSFALLLYSLVSLLAGSLIPYLTTLATTYPSLPARVGPAGRWALKRITPRNCWTVGLGWYAACMVLTFWCKGLKGATTVVAIAGVPWAITCWVPFALVMESIRELESAPTTAAAADDSAAQDPDRQFYHASSSSPQQPQSSPSYPRDAPRLPQDYGSVSQLGGKSRGAAGNSLGRAPFRVTTLRNSSYQPYGSQSSIASASGSTPSDWPRSPNAATHERTGLLSPTRLEATETDAEATPKPVGGGTILGLHNMAVVFPQFFVALVAAGIFKLTASRSASARNILLSLVYSATPPEAGKDPSEGPGGDGLRGQNDVVWVLRFGGLAALIGMVVSRWLCETRSEREYREYVEWGWRDALPPGLSSADGNADRDTDGSDC
ncbi:hypothetical protein JCM10908_000799 [Rhodotorula pacifica]|uniref:uncharacterized protein n=1 Tax=Rhodotorula pacifica TaxID=1495444 RepID=UPI00317602B9